jgi:hypothetical protein
MSQNIVRQLKKLSVYISQQAKPHRFLPTISKSIDELIQCAQEARYNPEKLRNVALGLGRYISDDFEFSESDTGTRILVVINSISKQTKKSA